MQIKANQEFSVGLIFTITGLLFLYFGRNYSVGDALNMGPGFLPFFLSVALVGLGFVQFARAWRDRTQVELDLMRPAIVSVTIAAFAYLLPWTGAVIGTGLVMLIVGSLHPSFQIRNWLISYAVVVVLILIFRFLLGSTIPLWMR
jgi:hypothetical protein